MSLDRVAIYGYGGVSPTAVAVLRDMNAKKIFIAGRDSSKAAAKAAQLGCDVWDGSVSTASLLLCAPRARQSSVCSLFNSW
jgi:shikimate 5-dehydrogenase